MNYKHSFISALILGITEGLTEFLPVSSTGHMIIVSDILESKDEISTTFEIVVQLGAILSSTIIFRQSLSKLVNLNLIKKYRFKMNGEQYLNIIHIIIGITPTLILGLIFHDNIKLLFNPVSVMYALLSGNLLLIITECLKPTEPNIIKLENITYQQAFIISCFQCLALWPGFSRSGATISGGVLTGVNRCTAVNFSFLLAIPIMIGATILDIYKNLNSLATENISILTIGLTTTFIVSLVSIKFFLKIITFVSLIPFAIYRFILAIIIYIIYF